MRYSYLAGSECVAPFQAKFVLELFGGHVELCWFQDGGLGGNGVVVLVDQLLLVNLRGLEREKKKDCTVTRSESSFLHPSYIDLKREIEKEGGRERETGRPPGNVAQL